MKLNNLYTIDKTWSLFLDRDGVINRRLVGDYVKEIEEFEFISGVTAALRIFNRIFGPILVISNQQGIGKGLMNHADVEAIHDFMLKHIEKQGGRIDKVYFSPHLKEENSNMRKPATGMGIRAKEDFPQIDFAKSIMAGDSVTDMEFGRALGMINVYINTDKESIAQSLCDFEYPNLLAFASEFNHKS